MTALYVALLRMQASRARLAVTGGASLLVALTGLPFGLSADVDHLHAGRRERTVWIGICRNLTFGAGVTKNNALVALQFL